MPRTIVYSSNAPLRPPPSEGPITFGGPAPAPAPARGGTGPTARRPREASIPDNYSERLAKYVPAEVLAFFAPTAAAVAGRNGLLIAATVVAFLATPAYLWHGAQKLPPDQKPLLFSYPLSAIAFLAWALGTSSIGSLMGLDPKETSFILGASVFLIPLADAILDDIRIARRKAVPRA